MGGPSTESLFYGRTLAFFIPQFLDFLFYLFGGGEGGGAACCLQTEGASAREGPTIIDEKPLIDLLYINPLWCSMLLIIILSASSDFQLPQFWSLISKQPHTIHQHHLNSMLAYTIWVNFNTGNARRFYASIYDGGNRSRQESSTCQPAALPVAMSVGLHSNRLLWLPSLDCCSSFCNFSSSTYGERRKSNRKSKQSVIASASKQMPDENTILISDCCRPNNKMVQTRSKGHKAPHNASKLRKKKDEDKDVAQLMPASSPLLAPVRKDSSPEYKDDDDASVISDLTDLSSMFDPMEIDENFTTHLVTSAPAVCEDEERKSVTAPTDAQNVETRSNETQCDDKQSGQIQDFKTQHDKNIESQNNKAHGVDIQPGERHSRMTQSVGTQTGDLTPIVENSNAVANDIDTAPAYSPISVSSADDPAPGQGNPPTTLVALSHRLPTPPRGSVPYRYTMTKVLFFLRRHLLLQACEQHNISPVSSAHIHPATRHLAIELEEIRQRALRLWSMVHDGRAGDPHWAVGYNWEAGEYLRSFEGEFGLVGWYNA